MKSFREYLRDAKKRKKYGDTPEQDFVDDCVRDFRFPEINTWRELQHHLWTQCACHESYEPAENVFNDWKKIKRRAISLKIRFRIMAKDGHRCRLCGKAASDGTILEIDHRIPVSRGGSDHEENLWTLCFECNRGKSDSNL